MEEKDKNSMRLFIVSITTAPSLLLARRTFID